MVKAIMKNLHHWMKRCMELAESARAHDEVPVGAIIVNEATGEIIAQAENRMRRNCDATAHAEMLVMREAFQKLKQERLEGLSLFVSLEPCAMCAAAISHARLARLVFGAYDIKSGGVENGARIYAHSTTHHKPEVIAGVMESEAVKILQDFFATKR